MSHDEIQSMMRVRHQLNDLRSFLNAGRILSRREIADYTADLAEAGVHPGIMMLNIKQWKEVNRVTTEYDEFDKNCQLALDHLNEPTKENE
jgi:hypothetical protein